MLEKIEGRNRVGQRISWLDCITNSMDGHELEQTLGDSEGQGSLVYYNSWHRKESDTTQLLNNSSSNGYGEVRRLDIRISWKGNRKYSCLHLHLENVSNILVEQRRHRHLYIKNNNKNQKAKEKCLFNRLNPPYILPPPPSCYKLFQKTNYSQLFTLSHLGPGLCLEEADDLLYTFPVILLSQAQT